jgi:hypothetical protein
VSIFGSSLIAILLLGSVSVEVQKETDTILASRVNPQEIHYTDHSENTSDTPPVSVVHVSSVPLPTPLPHYAIPKIPSPHHRDSFDSERSSTTTVVPEVDDEEEFDEWNSFEDGEVSGHPWRRFPMNDFKCSQYHKWNLCISPRDKMCILRKRGTKGYPHVKHLTVETLLPSDVSHIYEIGGSVESCTNSSWYIADI